MTFNAPASTTSAFGITLTVTTATTTNALYNNIGTTTKVISVGIIYAPTYNGTQLDVYVINNGTGTAYPQKSPTSLGSFNTLDTVDAYAPQQVMNLGTYVMFNNASVADKQVTIIVTPINDPTDLIATYVGTTDNTGHFDVSWRLPNYDSANMPSGTYMVNATVEVAQGIVSDAFTFQYGWELNITSISMSGLVARGDVVPEYMNVSINNISSQNQTYWMTYTVNDYMGVPILTTEIAAQIAPANGTTGQYNVQVFIPSFAFVGAATIHVNIFNADPKYPGQSALPYCPEQSAIFNIGHLPGQ